MKASGDIGTAVLNIKNGLGSLESIMEREPLILLKSKDGAWMNTPAEKLLKKKQIEKDNLLGKLQKERVNLNCLSCCGIDIIMLKLKGNDFLAIMKEGRPQKVFKLTEREREVLHLLVTGMTNKEIAQCLNGISPGTVNTHLDSIYRKLGATCRLQAAYIALKQGVVDTKSKPIDH